LGKADVSQATFGRRAGVTARQVNNWARGWAAVPQWAVLLTIAVLEQLVEALVMALEETTFSWSKMLGVGPSSEPAEARHQVLGHIPVQDMSRQKHIRTSGLNAPGAPMKSVRPPCRSTKTAGITVSSGAKPMKKVRSCLTDGASTASR